MPEFIAEEHQATVSEGLAQCPYVAARTGFELATLRTKGSESNNEPLCPTSCEEDDRKEYCFFSSVTFLNAAFDDFLRFFC